MKSEIGRFDMLPSSLDGFAAGFVDSGFHVGGESRLRGDEGPDGRWVGRFIGSCFGLLAKGFGGLTRGTSPEARRFPRRRRVQPRQLRPASGKPGFMKRAR